LEFIIRCARACSLNSDFFTLSPSSELRRNLFIIGGLAILSMCMYAKAIDFDSLCKCSDIILKLSGDEVFINFRFSILIG
jgi:hypothetical protein